jgi:sarcosine oxidase subunit gamma
MKPRSAARSFTILKEGASVPDFTWETQSPLRKALVVGRHGAGSGAAGVSLREVRDISLVQVMARRGQAAAMAKAAKKLFGVEPPTTPKAVAGKTATLIWAGPDQFMAFAPRSDEDFYAKLSGAFAGVASLSDQSDGRCMMRIGGPDARDALAKFCALDLHDSVFPVGAAASTAIDHTNASVWRSADEAGEAVYNILVFTSFSDSLWHTIADSALEYGLDAGHVSAVQ